MTREKETYIQKWISGQREEYYLFVIRKMNEIYDSHPLVGYFQVMNWIREINSTLAPGIEQKETDLCVEELLKQRKVIRIPDKSSERDKQLARVLFDGLDYRVSANPLFGAATTLAEQSPEELIAESLSSGSGYLGHGYVESKKAKLSGSFITLHDRSFHKLNPESLDSNVDDLADWCEYRYLAYCEKQNTQFEGDI